MLFVTHICLKQYFRPAFAWGGALGAPTARWESREIATTRQCALSLFRSICSYFLKPILSLICFGFCSRTHNSNKSYAGEICRSSSLHGEGVGSQTALFWRRKWGGEAAMNKVIARNFGIWYLFTVMRIGCPYFGVPWPELACIGTCLYICEGVASMPDRRRTL